MVGSLLVVLIILGCVAYQYLKSTLVKSFVAIITSICASVVAFGYFELLANILIGRNILVLWAYLLSFALLFILAFAILQTVAIQLIRQPINLGLWPERIGRAICGIFLGIIISGLLLTAVAMAPIPAKYPYQRFDATIPNFEEKPKKVLLNADGFATGWFSIISSGSFSGKRSFATLHPAFLDQLFLNRHEIDNRVPIITSSEAIEIPKIAVWPAPEGLKRSDGKELPKSGHTLTIVRVGLTNQAIESGATSTTFTPAQLRVICKQENDGRDPLAGKGKNIYPVGYLQTADELQIKKLTDHIEIKRSDFVSRIKEIDFAFYVPNGFKPVLVEFKQNNIKQLPAPVPAEQAPPPAPFIKQPESQKDTAAPAAAKPVEQPNSPPLPKPKAQPETSSKTPGLSNVGKSIVGDQLDENQ
jgi:hypothetical protein